MQQDSYNHQVPKQGDGERNSLGIFMLWGSQLSVFTGSGVQMTRDFVHAYL